LDGIRLRAKQKKKHPGNVQLTRRQALGAAFAASSPLARLSREKLTIRDIRVTVLSYRLPSDKVWMTATFQVWKSDCVIVEVLTDQGITGIGESSPYGGPAEIKRFIESEVRPLLAGKNPYDVEDLTGYWPGSPRGPKVAWAGVDTALWDIIARSKNKPLYEILAGEGKPQPRIRMYASGGVEYAWYKRPEDLIDEALRHREGGYTAFKFRIGTDWKSSGITVASFVPWLRKLREAVGPKFDLMLEGNMRWTLEEALELCPVIEELSILWVEEPVPQQPKGAIEQYLKINEALSSVKLSGGEQLASRYEFKEWIDRGAYDIVQPDANTAGITECWRIARTAELHGKLCCPHNWHGGLTTAANAQLVAAIPNRLMLELNQTFNPFKEEIFEEPLTVAQGYMQLPRRPGLGVSLKKDLEKRFPFIPGSYARPNPDLTRGQ
jgi:L-alanine-DL-glutamate epimerase-like enolase superfamily enzyme